MKRIQIIQLIVSLLIISYSNAYGQAGGKNTQELLDKLTAYSSTHITEKAYIHLDKPYYATGDTIYFKAYVTTGERFYLSHLSGMLHVDLINTTSKIDQSIKLQLINGLAWGDFALPDSLPPGNYRMRAYTQWMRNEGNYFEQLIPVGSVHNQKIPESATQANAVTNNKPDIQFMPEGGNLVQGLSSKVAFKAIGPNGLGVAVKGELLDNENKVVCAFTSSHLGMGYFYINPSEGKTYRAKVTYTNGITDMVDLAKPLANGIILTINNDSLQNASVQIEVNKAYFDTNKGKKYNLLIYSGGFATTVTIKLDSMISKLEIIKRRLRTGVTRVTLFSDSDEPLCERLFFVQNYDQLHLDISSDQQSYSTRGKVSVKLRARNRIDSAVAGHFSVAVIDESKTVVDENQESTILNNLLLTSDLKGTVEQPNYYFTNITGDKLQELDLVMLTHGYRWFQWKQVLTDRYQQLAWQPEKSLQISGKVENLWGKPVARASVSLISFQVNHFISTTADDKGDFKFDNLVFPDSAEFVLQAVNVKEKNRTKFIYNEDNQVPVTVLKQTWDTNNIFPVSYLENSKKRQEALSKLGLGKSRLLKEVKIKAIKKDDQYETQSFAGAGHADQVMHASEIQQIQGSLSTSLDGRLRGVTFVGLANKKPYLTTNLNGLNPAIPMLVIIDGAEVPAESINYYTPNQIETIEVLKYASSAAYGMQGGNGVLVITSKRGTGTDVKDIIPVGIQPITVRGYYKARQFYSPKYDSNTISNHPDLRSTIFWKPELITDQDGNASFDFYNADGKGSYRIVVEGIDGKGNLGRQVYHYKVD